MSQRENATHVRFALSQRIEHVLLMISFGMLCLTGLPQKFYTAGWARAILALLGGIDAARDIHHLFAIMLMFEALYHIVVIGYELILVRPRRLGILPRLQDVRDGLASAAYLLGWQADRPRYGRFDFKQKIEYWSMIWGTLVMGITGLLLLFPVMITRYLPGIVLPIAKVVHGYEAILAFLAIVTWHFYNAHLAEGAFPLDTGIFTGRISGKRAAQDHPLEHEQ